MQRHDIAPVSNKADQILARHIHATGEVIDSITFRAWSAFWSYVFFLILIVGAAALLRGAAAALNLGGVL